MFLATGTLRTCVVDQTDSHLKGVKRALRHLVGTSNTRLLLKLGQELRLGAYTDANWRGEEQ